MSYWKASITGISYRLMRTIPFLISIAVFSFFISSCIPSRAEEIPETDHILILAFDGWTSSSFDEADMPYLKSMVSQSAWTLHKRSILPTSSACNWATMFKGAGPEAHGYIAWDTQKPAFAVTSTDEKGNFPSFFSIYRKAFPNREMGYFYQWDGMKSLFDLDDFNCVEGFAVTDAGKEEMKEAAISYILQRKPSLAAFFWDYPDKTGHSSGWHSDAYLNELAYIDTVIESIVNACIEANILDRTLIIVTSDHGGHGKTHGEPLMVDLETPFFMFGSGVKPGEIQVALMQYDVASILADYVHLEHPEAWRGKTPESIF